MYSSYCSIWIPALIFQKRVFLSSSQRVEENTMKGGIMDYRSILYLIIIVLWSLNLKS